MGGSLFIPLFFFKRGDCLIIAIHKLSSSDEPWKHQMFWRSLYFGALRNKSIHTTKDGKKFKKRTPFVWSSHKLAWPRPFHVAVRSCGFGGGERISSNIGISLFFPDPNSRFLPTWEWTINIKAGFARGQPTDRLFLLLPSGKMSCSYVQKKRRGEENVGCGGIRSGPFFGRRQGQKISISREK